MPCSDGGPSYADQLNERIRVKEDLLCSACRVLERLGYDFDENPELSRWWHVHKAEDQRRIEREEAERARKALRKRMAKELSQKPIAELTAEDKRILREEGYL
jgi:hypothetical protein